MQHHGSIKGALRGGGEALLKVEGRGGLFIRYEELRKKKRGPEGGRKVRITA